MEERFKEFIQSLIDSGTLTETQMEEAKSFLPQPDLFTSENCEASENNLMLFAMLRKLLMNLDSSDHTELLKSIMQKVDPCILTCIVHHMRKLDGKEFKNEEENCYQKFSDMLINNPEVTKAVDEMEITPENIIELIEKGKPEEHHEEHVTFSAKGDKCVVEYLTKLKEKLSDEDKVEVDKVISFLDKAPEVIQFVDTELAQSIVDAGYKLTEIDDKVVISNENGTLEMTITKDPEGNLTLDGITPSELLEYVKSKLDADRDLIVNVDSETGEILEN